MLRSLAIKGSLPNSWTPWIGTKIKHRLCSLARTYNSANVLSGNEIMSTYVYLSRQLDANGPSCDSLPIVSSPSCSQAPRVVNLREVLFVINVRGWHSMLRLVCSFSLTWPTSSTVPRPFLARSALAVDHQPTPLLRGTSLICFPCTSRSP